MALYYDQIAHGYDRHRRGGGPYLDTLAALLETCPGRRALELGAGTGNNTIALYEISRCDIIALEPSRGMLQQAVAKRIPARWVRGAAPDLPFADQSFDFVFATYVLHYVADLTALFQECGRVLQKGCGAFVTAPTDFIARHPMNAYFPSFAKVDLARFLPVEAVAGALRGAGFHSVDSKTVTAPPRPVDTEFVERVAGKFVSTYDLLPPGEFEAGLARLRADVKAKGRLDEPMIWEAAIIWGYR